MKGQAEEDPFFVLEVEQNPLDGHADNAVTVKMRHLEIIYHKGYVEAVVDSSNRQKASSSPSVPYSMLPDRP